MIYEPLFGAIFKVTRIKLFLSSCFQASLRNPHTRSVKGWSSGMEDQLWKGHLSPSQLKMKGLGLHVGVLFFSRRQPWIIHFFVGFSFLSFEVSLEKVCLVKKSLDNCWRNPSFKLVKIEELPSWCLNLVSFYEMHVQRLNGENAYCLLMLIFLCEVHVLL